MTARANDAGRALSRLVRMAAAFGVAATVLAGAFGSGPAAAQETVERGLFVFDTPIEITLAETPADIAVAMLAVIARMRGVSDPEVIEPAVFVGSVGERLAEESFFYEGFDVEAIQIGYLGPSESGGIGRRIYGAFRFADPLGRRATTSFGIDYVVNDANVFIDDAALRTAGLVEPDVRLYVLDSDDVPDDFLAEVSDHVAFLQFVAENAVPVADMAETEGADDYTVIALSLDRLPADGSLYVNVSAAASGDKISMGKQLVLDFDGWRAVAVRGFLDVSADSPLAIEALYSPSYFAPEGLRELASVARFVPGVDR